MKVQQRWKKIRAKLFRSFAGQQRRQMVNGNDREWGVPRSRKEHVKMHVAIHAARIVSDLTSTETVGLANVVFTE